MHTMMMEDSGLYAVGYFTYCGNSRDLPENLRADYHELLWNPIKGGMYWREAAHLVHFLNGGNLDAYGGVVYTKSED